MKNRLVCMTAFALALGILYSFLYINPYNNEIALSETVLQLSGSRGPFSLGFSLDGLITFSLKLIPSFLTEIFLGTWIYRSFCTASIYVFSRYPKRIRWYFSKVLQLFFIIFFLSFIYTLSAVLTAQVRLDLYTDILGNKIFFYHIVIHSIWTATMCLLMNCIAICLGSNIAYSVTMSFQIICIAFLHIADFLIQKKMVGSSYSVLLKFDPLAHIVLGWHTDVILFGIDGVNRQYLDIDLRESVFLLAILMSVLIFVGAALTKNHEFYSNDLEKEVA